MNKDNLNLAEMLGTKNKKEQAEKVAQLLRIVNMPIIDVVIRFDPIVDQVDVRIIGGNIGFDVAHHILDLTRKHIQQDEVKASIDLRAKQNGGQQQHPDLPVEDSAEPFPELSAPEVAAE